MVNIKYDVSDVEDFVPYSGPMPPRGIYEGKIISPSWEKSSGGNMMFKFTVILEPKKSDQKKFKGAPIFGNMVIADLSEEYQKRNMRQIVKALGLPEKGGFNPEAVVKKMTDKLVRVVVKTENSEEYGVQSKFNGLLPFKSDEPPAEDEDAGEEADGEEPEGEEPEGDEEEAETSVEEDIADLTRPQLKKYIKDNSLEVKVTTKMSDDDVRNAIVEAWPDEEEAEEEAEDEDDGLDELDRSALKKHIKENSLEIKVTTKMSDDDIREAIRAASSDEDGEEDSEDEPPF